MTVLTGEKINKNIPDFIILIFDYSLFEKCCSLICFYECEKILALNIWQARHYCYINARGIARVSMKKT